MGNQGLSAQWCNIFMGNSLAAASGGDDGKNGFSVDHMPVPP